MNKRVIVIGAGPGGYVAALRAAALGAEVTVIEKEHVGGTCLNWGCIPSKIMKNSADHYAKFLKADQFGIQFDGTLSMDMNILHDKKNKIITGQQKGISALLEGQGINIVNGQATISTDTTVKVLLEDGTIDTFDYDRLVVATGTTPMNVSDFPFDHRTILSSNDLLSMAAIPASMVIVGGGVIGCEFACIFSALGTKVTIVEAMSRLLPMPFVDQEISKMLLREMKKHKIKVILDAVVKSSSEMGSMLTIQLESSPFTDNPKPKPLKQASIETKKMAVCIGRTAVSKDLGLENIGVPLSREGWIKTDEKMQTSVDGVYGIGDVLGPEKVMLAHVASHEGMIAAQNAMGQTAKMEYDVVPGAIFTNPEIGVVGLSESQAVEKELNFKSVSVNFRNLGKAHAIGEIAGMAKIIFDEFSGKLLGAHIIGAHATDLIAQAAQAIKNGLTVEDISHTIHAHPTLAEIMGEVCLKAAGSPIHG